MSVRRRLSAIGSGALFSAELCTVQSFGTYYLGRLTDAETLHCAQFLLRRASTRGAVRRNRISLTRAE